MSNDISPQHQDKHTRPYICDQYSCSNKSFGDKAGLQRHKQEVHGSETDHHFCLFSSCNRNKRGFPRKYNLLEHQKRRHGMQFRKVSRSGMGLSETASLRAGSAGIDCRSGEGGEGFSPAESRSYGEGDETTNQDLRVKLQSLRVMRAKIDKDIAS